MPMTAPPAKTSLSDTYPNPTNAVARTGLGVLWDFATGLLGPTGFLAGMLSTSKLLDPSALYNVSLVPSVAGNALTMKLTSGDGATALAAGNPATAAMRNATLANGTYNVRNITGDLTTVISSGSTAGHANAVASPIYWYLIDNTGTLELAWSTKNFGISGLVTTVAEGGAGAADSATVMYSTTARTGVPYRLVGRTIDTQTTAGTWTANPTSIELFPMSGGGFSYEEGIWVPSVGGTATYTTQSGFYVKLGRLVHFQCEILIATIGTGSTTAITGLPHPIFAKGVCIGMNSNGVAATAITSSLIGFLNNAINTIQLYSKTAATTIDSGNAIFGNGTGIILSGTYMTLQG